MATLNGQSLLARLGFDPGEDADLTIDEIKAKLYEETYTKRPPLAVVLETLDKTAKA